MDPDPERYPDAADAAAARLFGDSQHSEWQELVTVMNGFDTNLDDENEFQACASRPGQRSPGRLSGSAAQVRVRQLWVSSLHLYRGLAIIRPAFGHPTPPRFKGE